MVRDENPAGFTVDSKIVFLSIFVLAFSAGEREVNGKALEWASCSTCCIISSRFFSLLGAYASRAFVKDRVKVFEFGHTVNEFMCCVQSCVRWVT